MMCVWYLVLLMFEHTYGSPVRTVSGSSGQREHPTALVMLTAMAARCLQ